MNPENPDGPDLPPRRVMFGLLFYYSKRFDPDKVDEKNERRSDVFTILRGRRAAPE